MSQTVKPLLEDIVRKDWIDYNGHMTDAAYAIVFSMAVDRLMIVLGINADFRNQYHYSIYTLETHLLFIKEAHEGQGLRVTIHLLDHDAKRLHVFFVMENDQGDRLATSEQMLMGMDMTEGRPAPFPASIKTRVENMANDYQSHPMPNEAGRKIGIRKN
ncbi:thioesterase family protein [Peribacillus sp. JNUCC 23]|uniref:thioesterase family protein n=1 Tax=Peribacillus sp. NPDC096379 TaxID=3364393 RepID=UPI00078164C2